jgi:hypothetical protein
MPALIFPSPFSLSVAPSCQVSIHHPISVHRPHVTAITPYRVKLGNSIEDRNRAANWPTAQFTQLQSFRFCSTVADRRASGDRIIVVQPRAAR